MSGTASAPAAGAAMFHERQSRKFKNHQPLKTVKPPTLNPMARAARTIFVALCLLALAKIVLACDAAHYLNSIRAGDADAVSQCLASGLVVKPIRDEVWHTF